MKIGQRTLALMIAGIIVVSGCKLERETAGVDDLKVPAEQSATVQVASTSVVDRRTWESDYGAENPRRGVYSSLSLGTARSLEEAQWLKRQGFLSRSKIERLSKLPFKELEKLARAGDHDAVLFMGEKLVSEGRGDLIAPALDKLIEARGSIPALELRARYKSSKVSSVPEQLPTSSWEWREATMASTNTKVDVAADYFAAYILGDYRGSQVVTSMFSHDEGVPPVVYTEAMKRVAKISDARKAPGRSPINLDPRPMPEGVRGAMEPF